MGVYKEGKTVLEGYEWVDIKFDIGDTTLILKKLIPKFKKKH